MIDIHSHVLPFVDDGSGSVADSLSILKTAETQGVTDLICTPHHRAPYLKTPSELTDNFNLFKQKAAEEGININLYLGQEIKAEKDIKNLIAAGEVLTLSDSPFVLIEFDFNRQAESDNIVYELKNAGFKPIVAHYERYSYATMDEAYEIKRAGGLIQVNADSLVGKSRHFYGKTAKALLREGFADFVASDVHVGRDYLMADAYKFVEKKYGEACAKVVFEVAAKKIIR